MPISRRLKEYLEMTGKPYQIHSHVETFTAQGLAAVEHVPGQEVVKVVVLTGGERYFMAALPAPRKVDLVRFAVVVKVPNVRLATELEFQNLFPGCETGGMPPFGNLYGLDVFLDQALMDDAEIVFQACTHRESIRMKMADYLDLVRPKVADFSTPAG